MGDRVTLAQKLLIDYRSKALELLVDYLQDKEIRTATEQYIGQHNPSTVRLDTTFEQQPKPSRTRSHHLDSSPLPGTARQTLLDARHDPRTPPTSAGSVKSYNSSLAAAGMEKIYLLSCDDEGSDQPVISKRAAVKHNLVGHNVVYSRGLGVRTHLVDELVTVPLPSGGWRREKVTNAVNLTWRRCKEFKTTGDTFYVVSSKLLDSDVILGSEESLEHQLPSDVQEANSPQALYQRGFVEMEELDQTVPPRAPTVPMHSYPQTSTNVQRIYQRVQNFRETQNAHVAEPSAPVPDLQRVNHRQQTQKTTPLASQEPSSGQLQVIGLWDKTPIKMSFDPDASGETFYQAFHQWAVRRQRDGDLERHRMTLWLKTNKGTHDNEAYELSLKEGDLEELWEAAVDWIQENKNPKAPHLYATVELEAG